MIKKYRQYVESKFTSKEELDDQFLRLKEVFGCHILYRKDLTKYISWDLDKLNFYLVVLIPEDKFLDLNAILEEIDRIENDMKMCGKKITLKELDTHMGLDASYLREAYGIYTEISGIFYSDMYTRTFNRLGLIEKIIEFKIQ
jgi:hypothetical protein